jgi:hypothetical protein
MKHSLPTSGSIMESEMDKLCQATPSTSLEEQIRSANVPKNEREWWAKRHIDYLHEVIDERNSDIASLREQLSNMMAVVASVEKERDEWKEIAEDLAMDKGTYFRLYEQACIRLTEKDASLGSCCRKNDEQLSTLQAMYDELVETLKYFSEYGYGREICLAALAKVGADKTGDGS